MYPFSSSRVHFLTYDMHTSKEAGSGEGGGFEVRQGGRRYGTRARRPTRTQRNNHLLPSLCCRARQRSGNVSSSQKKSNKPTCILGVSAECIISPRINKIKVRQPSPSPSPSPFTWIYVAFPPKPTILYTPMISMTLDTSNTTCDVSTSAHLGVENGPIHDAAAENNPLGRDNENQAGAEAGERVGSRLPDRVLVGDLGQVLPCAVLWVVGHGSWKRRLNGQNHAMPCHMSRHDMT